MRRLHDVDERGDVVVGDRLAIADRLTNAVVGDGRVGAARCGVGGGHDAERGVGLGGQQLDLEVAAEAGRVGEHRGHLRQRVPGDHCQLQHSVAGGAGADDAHRHADLALDQGDEVARPSAAASATSFDRARCRTSQPAQHGVDRVAVGVVLGADLDLGERVEHVELGERELGERVEAHGLAQHHAVEPAGAPAATGDGAELAADVDELVAELVEQLGGERAAADAGGVRLGDADDAGEVARADAGADARAAGGRVATT